jgi:hypothetical protein
LISRTYKTDGTLALQADVYGAGEPAIVFPLDVSYTHEAWRGRIRASAEVAASLPAEQVEAFDQELAALLRERFPQDPIDIPHRVFAAVGRTSA